MNNPKTLEEARDKRYNLKVDTFYSQSFKEGFCAHTVKNSLGYHSHAILYPQCSRKNGHGPEGLYCKQHAGKIKED